MSLNCKLWQSFILNRLYDISMGNKLDKDDLLFSDPLINYVSRISSNNGVKGKVDLIDGVTPFEPGMLTVALGGEYLGSCFLQAEAFYTSQNIVVLKPKYEEMSKYVNLFISCLVKFEANAKYCSFGRELNSYIDKSFDIKLPVKMSASGIPIIDKECTFSDDGYVPDWDWIELFVNSIHHKPLSTINNNLPIRKLDTKYWKDFLLADFFDITSGTYYKQSEYSEGKTPYYSAKTSDNGIMKYINLPPDFEGNCIVAGKEGCNAFYAPKPFCATSDVNIFEPRFNMSIFCALFIVSVINYSENYKWQFGRQCRVGNSKKIKIKLPSDKNGDPDWNWMEKYIKKFPLADRLI